MPDPTRASAPQAQAVLAAALGMTCVDPKDKPDIGFCRAGRHSDQARKVIDLLASQGYEVRRVTT